MPVANPLPTGVDYTGGRELSYAQITAAATSTATAPADVTGLSVTLTAGSRPLYLRFWARAVKHSVAGGMVGLALVSGDGLTTYANIFPTLATANTEYPMTPMWARVNGLTVGNSYTFKIQMWSNVGGGTVTLQAVAAAPAFLAVVEG